MTQQKVREEVAPKTLHPTHPDWSGPTVVKIQREVWAERERRMDVEAARG